MYDTLKATLFLIQTLLYSSVIFPARPNSTQVFIGVLSYPLQSENLTARYIFLCVNPLIIVYYVFCKISYNKLSVEQPVRLPFKFREINIHIFLYVPKISSLKQIILREIKVYRFN